MPIEGDAFMPTTATNAFTGAGLLLDTSFRQQLRLAWRLLRDERVTSLKYLLPALVTLYVASPVDPIPDFFLGIGQMDDLGLVIASLVLAVRIIPKLAPADVVAEHAAAISGAEPNAGAAANEGTFVDAPYRVRD
jgi:uncharacterized membrane protein YkvA (DUF1232 family)